VLIDWTPLLGQHYSATLRIPDQYRVLLVSTARAALRPLAQPSAHNLQDSFQVKASAALLFWPIGFMNQQNLGSANSGKRSHVGLLRTTFPLRL
jgi:hypothetical protein